MTNPFNEGTKAHSDFETMSDLKWHCTKCELKSGQAKTWQVWRQEKGIQIDTDEKGNFYKIIYCDNCGEKTYHRKLKSLEILKDTKSRSGIPATLSKKVKQLYNNLEAVYFREISPNQLEVDHKFPQVRWNKDESDNGVKMTEEEIKDKFILLTRSHNLLKSRYCEKCYKLNERGSFPGINYWYEGNSKWDSKIDKHNKKGCEGCFWYDPFKWRDELNKLVNK